MDINVQDLSSGQEHIVFERLLQSYLKDPVPALKYRLDGLKRLENGILRNKERITRAVQLDLNKSPFETETSEILTTLIELRTARKNLRFWMQDRNVATPTELIGTSHWITYEPKGVVLILSPWNYPVHLSLCPLVAAWAAGNKIVLKPSELSPHTSAVLSELIRECFSDDEVSTLTGDSQLSETLVGMPFHHIFFTGSKVTARKILKRAAERLTPVTLELGGKNPLILDETVHLAAVMKDLVYSKCINAGQTCISPDFVLLPASMMNEFARIWELNLEKLYGGDICNNEDYSGIIDDAHLQRLLDLIRKSEAQGARLSSPVQVRHDNRKMRPLLLLDSDWHHESMSDEIFGPVLPLVAYDSLDEALSRLNQRHRSLGLHIFSNHRPTVGKIILKLRSGGVCINQCFLNYCNFKLPFGGNHQSGHGAYHGVFGFEEFSHRRSISRQGRLFHPLRLFYPPFDKVKSSIKQITYKLLGRI
ncbi:MAG TPA: aldehyde dehydrogenase family protein [Saprospiraceae bacterium]|nr:aldehyde dehydrogenase family protein [Saprospiraceae bacterium]